MKHKTNIDLVKHLMTFSKQGVLMQAFIIEAIVKYAEAVKANPLPDTGFISAAAWDACAKEAFDAINNRNKGEANA
jgi:hypothetical protein